MTRLMGWSVWLVPVRVNTPMPRSTSVARVVARYSVERHSGEYVGWGAPVEA
jgi:hypothetical protein